MGTSKNRMIFLLKSYLTMRKSVVKRVCMGQQALSDEGTAIFRGALMEECKSSVRAKVEHLFFYVKQMFGYSKTRYRVLSKNENRLALLLGFANLLSGESCMA